MAKTRPYLFYDTAVSLCHECLRRVEAKQVIQDGEVWMYKWCPEHGTTKVLIASDADYWRRAREVYIKPPEMPLRFNTEMRFGCPYDCGLCPDHMQHSCLTIVEITDHCNLACPICYASSGPHRPGYRDLATIEKMFDAIVANEGEPDVVQISGGEPTLHPDFFSRCSMRREGGPIKHLMLNTNGIRIANEPGFAEKLAAYQPGFEVYLQWDSLDPDALRTLPWRGSVRHPATCAAAAQRIGSFDYVGDERWRAASMTARSVRRSTSPCRQPCVRGVTLQPVQYAGRTEQYDPKRQRLTLTEVRSCILEQTKLFQPQDVIPVPCNPDALAMAYALKGDDGRVQPLTGVDTAGRCCWPAIGTRSSSSATATCASGCSRCSPRTTVPIRRRAACRICCVACHRSMRRR